MTYRPPELQIGLNGKIAYYIISKYISPHKRAYLSNLPPFVKRRQIGGHWKRIRVKKPMRGDHKIS